MGDQVDRAEEAETQRLTALRSYHLLDHRSEPASALLPSSPGQDAEDPTAPRSAVRTGAPAGTGTTAGSGAAVAAGPVSGAEIDAITRLAAAIAGVPFASVNLIDEHHQHPLSSTGTPPAPPARPIPRTQSLCATHFSAGEPVHVPDLSRDPRYADHPWVDGRLGALRSYTSVPLLSPDGHALGTLCATDLVPRRLDEERLARLCDLAAVLVALFERHRDAVLHAHLAAEAEAQRALAQSLMAEQQHRAQQLTQLARASSALATAEDPRTAICHAARRLTDADGVYLLQPDGHGRLVSTAVVGFPDGGDRAPDPDSHRDPLLDLDLTRERGLPLATFRSGKQRFVADVAAHPDADPALVETLGTVSGAWQPILLRAGTCTGVLGIVWRHRREDLDATLAWALHTLAREAAHTLERADLLAQLTEASRRDPLTGVGNRRHWDEVAAREVGRAERSGDPLTFALIDLDHFKAYNDAYGHLIGDDLLREFAAAAGAQLRPGDTIARWGGEEFALALPGCDLEQARDVADRIRAVVPHAQTATAGLAQWTPGASAATVLARADAALYRGKEAGRDTTATA
ncbi:diguanylate cyclase domain-containing protein [Kineococcus radiotolerans]|uniref:sensor domain-containing diguanylate cyclase n=1 Tax=Kineococcus radiotolerans TaxID=131568 RepID=UPI00003A3DCF|nr:diguanylate cyclase [Kineococcus radiotolerans]